MKLEIDERNGCIAVIDADKRDGRQGLDGNAPHVLWYESGVWTTKQCDKCGQDCGGEWGLRYGARDRAEAKLAELLASMAGAVGKDGEDGK